MTAILHIARRADWEAAGDAGEYTPGAGVVFCCRPSQLALVARLHFADQRDRLLLHLETSETVRRVEEFDPDDARMQPLGKRE